MDPRALSSAHPRQQSSLSSKHDTYASKALDMFQRLKASHWSSRIRALHPRSAWTPHVRNESSQASRVDRITARLPHRLQKYTNGLRNAPVSHIVSFLILHELTAIVPLFLFFGLFHYTTFVPVEYMSAHFGKYVQSGVSRFEKYFCRKGWFGFQPDDVERDGPDGSIALGKWDSGEPKYKVLVEVALAYAVTKAILPIRVFGSAWATPWFARVLLRIQKTLRRRP